ncbi:Crp/Fnr family transcriptional regulator [Xiamenia xianingshaonis]|uniref:Crp/Fnr family transcriptional regulator n=1 Tax=Xiamenia xianingshaonis TaxID=2682776 RepID=UPI00140D625B|nr:Crp/Fnr family transcriptional regulator [Xiamenia xianingshaonis]
MFQYKQIYSISDKLEISLEICSTVLFNGVSQEEAATMLPCLNARERNYEHGEYIFRAGQTTSSLGVVLDGRVRVEVSNAWGDISILETRGPGELFALGYACLPNEPLDIDVVADCDARIALIEAKRMIHPCPTQCLCHTMVAGNLMRALASRNLEMNRRAMATTPKTVRGKIMAYLSQVQKLAGTQSFDIPYSQTKLANFLGVDRSTLSAELSQLRKDGAIDYKGRRYTLL